jgi:hypothetical protein
MRNNPVNRALLGAAGVIASLGIAACGSASASGASTPSTSPSSGGRTGLARNATFGQLVRINGSTLILSSSTGDSTVTYATTTTITQTSTGSLANVTPGLCITAAGTKDATGTLVATTVLLSAPVSGSCTTGFRGGAGGTFSPPAGATPRPSFSPPAGAGSARGLVKSVTGTSVTLTETTGTTTTTVTINVPTTVKVTTSSVVQPSALQTGQCLTALGTKNSSGTVAARSLSITPAGANGCTAGFGRGGFGGGGGGFGGGGGGFGGAGGGATGA